MPRSLLPAWVLVFSWPAPLALADALEMFGFGGRDRAMGGVGIATSRDFSATYYNPAALTQSGRSTVGFSMLNVSYQPDFSTTAPEKKAGADRIPALSGVSFGFSARFGFGGVGDINPSEGFLCANCRYPVQTSDRQCPNCLVALRPISEARRGEDGAQGADYRFGVGFGMFLPTGDLISFGSQKSAIPQWVNYESTVEKLGIYFGVAAGYREWIALGLGLTVLSDAEVAASADVNIGGTAAVNFGQSIGPDATPNVGLFSKIDRWSLGFVYRGELSLKVETLNTTNTTFFGVGRTSMIMIIESIALFTPAQIGAGVAYRFEGDTVLAFDLTRYQWSAFPGTGTQSNPLPNSGITFAPVIPVRPKFKDIMVPRFGVETPVSADLLARAGYLYRPTPTSDLKNVENSLMDPTKHVLTAGIAYRSAGYPPFEVEFYVQYHAFISESHRKTSAPTSSDPAVDPAVPDLKFGGSILVFGLAAVIEF